MGEYRDSTGRALKCYNPTTCAHLESKQDFSTWIKTRIDQYGFVDGVDFTVHKFMDSGSRGQATVDYHISLDMAKELSIVERNAKGKQAGAAIDSTKFSGDYVINKIMNNLGGRPTIDYHITLDMAKELSMVERNAKGKQAGAAELAHSDFMKKIKLVLGLGAGNFSGSYRSLQNKDMPCCYLPKREASLMVMSESYAVHPSIDSPVLLGQYIESLPAPLATHAPRTAPAQHRTAPHQHSTGGP